MLACSSSSADTGNGCGCSFMVSKALHRGIRSYIGIVWFGYTPATNFAAASASCCACNVQPIKFVVLNEPYLCSRRGLLIIEASHIQRNVKRPCHDTHSSLRSESHAALVVLLNLVQRIGGCHRESCTGFSSGPGVNWARV